MSLIYSIIPEDDFEKFGLIYIIAVVSGLLIIERFL